VAVCITGGGRAGGVKEPVSRGGGEYWTVCYQGSVVRLKDAKGLRHLARPLGDPGREFHTSELEAADRPAAPARSQGRAAGQGLVVRRGLGDAGVLVDATAKAAYQARLVELRAELEEAEGGNDRARAAKAQAELAFLVAELARAVGLGGRDRRAAAHAERARLNATRAIRAAMANLARANPLLGRHLVVTVRTGRYCSYTPGSARPDRLGTLTRVRPWGPALAPGDGGAKGEPAHLVVHEDVLVLTALPGRVPMPEPPRPPRRLRQRLRTSPAACAGHLSGYGAVGDVGSGGSTRRCW
jgi:hypothetical protein